LLVLYFLSNKIIKKFRVLLFLLILFIGLYVQTINDQTYQIVSYTISLYEEAVLSSLTVLLRIIILISLSALLTLSTKPTDLNSGIEGIFAPFKFMRAQISIFAMMISIALRSIPTLINESQRILKAQASRGVDFNEGKLKEKVNQIVSLLVPMFVISYKKAEDLAYAMEARGYIPGKERSKLEVLKYKLSDYLVYVFVLLFISLIIIGKILKVI
jgi:energy-coupling factor transport system permease protein